MIYEHELLNPVRYVISMAAYNLGKSRFRVVESNRIQPWLIALCEDLSISSNAQWPDLYAEDNPILCEFCGTQLGTHYAGAVVRKGYAYDTCCEQLAVRIEQPELFWHKDRLRIEGAIATYMNVPRYIIQHCMAIELLSYIHNRKNIHDEQQFISSIDANGFERVNSLI